MPTYERENNYMETEADVLNDLLKVLNISEAILFGHSDGGTIALITAAKYPEKITAVICEAGHIFVEDVTVKVLLMPYMLIRQPIFRIVFGNIMVIM